MAVLEAPRELIHNKTFNVGRTHENCRIRELAEIVAETIPGLPDRVCSRRGPDKHCYRVTCDKIRCVLLDFRPQWTARKDAQELYDTYRAVGVTAEDVECGCYIRIAQIQRLQKAMDNFLRWRERVTA